MFPESCVQKRAQRRQISGANTVTPSRPEHFAWLAFESRSTQAAAQQLGSSLSAEGGLVKTDSLRS
jgi:hypothetical protein